jgi:hypothetical protein
VLLIMKFVGLNYDIILTIWQVLLSKINVYTNYLINNYGRNGRNGVYCSICFENSLYTIYEDNVDRIASINLMIIWCIAVKCHFISGWEKDKTNVILCLPKHAEKITLSYSFTYVSLIMKQNILKYIKKLIVYQYFCLLYDVHNDWTESIVWIWSNECND